MALGRVRAAVVRPRVVTRGVVRERERRQWQGAGGSRGSRRTTRSHAAPRRSRCALGTRAGRPQRRGGGDGRRGSEGGPDRGAHACAALPRARARAAVAATPAGSAARAGRTRLRGGVAAAGRALGGRTNAVGAPPAPVTGRHSECRLVACRGAAVAFLHARVGGRRVGRGRRPHRRGRRRTPGRGRADAVRLLGCEPVGRRRRRRRRGRVVCEAQERAGRHCRGVRAGQAAGRSRRRPRRCRRRRGQGLVASAGRATVRGAAVPPARRGAGPPRAGGRAVRARAARFHRAAAVPPDGPRRRQGAVGCRRVDRVAHVRSPRHCRGGDGAAGLHSPRNGASCSADRARGRRWSASHSC
mmetsp:Transcript_16617/g.58123  ORF Transcript_16617/g.58123 Transcript_16617/m.58123 type:complete len:357 (+) Transcript_16617:852-1922(+)